MCNGFFFHMFETLLIHVYRTEYEKVAYVCIIATIGRHLRDNWCKYLTTEIHLYYNVNNNATITQTTNYVLHGPFDVILYFVNPTFQLLINVLLFLSDIIYFINFDARL